MTKVTLTILTAMIFNFAWAETQDKVTIDDHTRALQTCKSLKIKGVNCATLADQCHAAQDMTACIKEKANDQKK